MLKEVMKMFWSYDKVNHPKDETIVFQEEICTPQCVLALKLQDFSHSEADLTLLKLEEIWRHFVLLVSDQ